MRIIKYLKNKRIEKKFINKFFQNKKEFLIYKKEVIDSGIIEHLKEKQKWFENNIKGKTSRGNYYTIGTISINSGIKIYSIIRKTKPEVLVETGVCNGFSTAFILLAVYKNKKGRLYSIDFPEVEGIKEIFWEGKGGAVIPKGKQSGWVIPEYLKENWELITGKSQDKLPPLLKKLEKIDFFMHDSEHSPECMQFESNEAFKVMNKGIILFDDIGWNNSFYNFCDNNKKKIIKIEENIGFIII